MDDAPSILFLDVAGIVGCSEGRPGEKPRSWHWKLGGEGASQEERGYSLLRKLSEHLQVSQPRLVGIEAPLAPAVLANIGSKADDAAFQMGTAFLAKVVAYGRGVPMIKFVNVQDVRQHFVQQRRFKGKNDGKRAVLQRCRDLGWEVDTFDEADAAAGWSYCCHRWFPRHAQHVEPLLIGANGR